MKWNNSLYPLIIVFTIIFSSCLLLSCMKKVLRESKFCLFLIVLFFNATYFILNCKRSEPRSHFISRWNMIVQLSVLLNRTVVDSD